MAQLSDDCFAFGGPLIGLDEALKLLLERTAAVTGTEKVPLAAARGRVLADDIVAPRDVPPHDNSAVDGYALYFDDLAPGAETVLPVAGRAAAGHPLEGQQRRATAVRIFTGAPMPPGEGGAPGPDTVLMQEDCRVEDGTVVIPPGIKRGGILNVVRHEIPVRCPADAIPEHFDVDLTGLEIGDSVHISAIKLPDGVKPTITERDFTVATIVGRAAEEPVPGAAAAVAEPGAEEAAAPAEAAAPEKEKEKESKKKE